MPGQRVHLGRAISSVDYEVVARPAARHPDEGLIGRFDAAVQRSLVKIYVKATTPAAS